MTFQKNGGGKNKGEKNNNFDTLPSKTGKRHGGSIYGGRECGSSSWNGNSKCGKRGGVSDVRGDIRTSHINAGGGGKERRTKGNKDAPTQGKNYGGTERSVDSMQG